MQLAEAKQASFGNDIWKWPSRTLKILTIKGEWEGGHSTQKEEASEGGRRSRRSSFREQLLFLFEVSYSGNSGDIF